MATGTSKSTPLILGLLAIFILAVLLFFGVLIRYIQHPSAGPTIKPPTLIATFTPVPSRTPTVTPTITISPRPTWTLRPSATTTQTPTTTFTPTPTLVRTVTPAKPARYNDRYELKPWDLAQQQRTIELLTANTILSPSNVTFSILAYGEGEALLRFPDSLDAQGWRWDRAYNLLRIGDPQAILLYTDLLKSGISSGQVRSSDLPSWFSSYETRLTLVTSSLPPQPGELARILVEISGEGSAFLWLVETPVSTDIFPLLNDVSYDQPHENAYLYADLTADGSPELIIYRSTTPGLTQYLLPHIFGLATTPPDELQLQEQVPFDFGLEPRTEVETVSGSAAHNNLRVTSILMPSCPVHATQEFTWNGEIFNISPLHYQINPVEGFLAYCELALNEASDNWGPEAALSLAAPLLDIWPPEKDTQGHPYPLDASDELRYRLGVLYALADQPAEATRLMSEIIDTPTLANSSWVTPAEEFLRTYQSPQDLYIACQLAQFCNLRDALNTMVEYSSTDNPDLALDYLEQHGVKVRSSAYFDFDQDGQAERWLVILPKPEAKLEFWILSRLLKGVQPVFVEIFEAGQSFPFYHEPAGPVPVVQFELHEGFEFKRLADTRQAYIEWVDVEYARSRIILDGYNQAMSALMDGADPAAVRDSLIELSASPRFAGDCIAYRICDAFHYTLALAYNLTGEDSNAIDQYLWVWRNYGQSPYSLIARLKLDYFPLPTFTATSPPSRTPTLTATPGTVTPTNTSTSTSTVQP